MGAATKIVESALVVYDTTSTHRWYDAFGICAKYVSDFGFLPLPDANAPSGFTTTLVNSSTVALGTAGGGQLVITTDTAENDGAQLQVTGEAYDLSGSAPMYFGIKFQADEETQSDFLAGLCITDTTLLAGMTDGIYFRKVDGSTDVEFVCEKDSAESTAVIDTFAVDTDVVYEMYFDGTSVYVYVDGTLTLTKVVAAETNFPDDEELTPSVAFLTGAAAAQVMTIDWLRAIQCN